MVVALVLLLIGFITGVLWICLWPVALVLFIIGLIFMFIPQGQPQA